MNNWREILISDDMSIREVIEIIDRNASQIALVTDADGSLLGTVTDGDIRRAILHSIPLEKPAKLIMNSKPTVARPNEDHQQIFARMQKKGISHIPILDDQNVVIGLETLKDFLEREDKNNIVVLMAGGAGKRLKPLTDDCPKPLLKIGSRPILQTIIENFLEYQFKRFYISVNYKSEMVKEYFGDGSRFGAEIKYLHEESQLGTAGALGLLPEKPMLPILVMNGDILTKVNFDHVINDHTAQKSVATMCVKEYDMLVPYGVVETNGNKVVSIREKPVHRFFVNAGIYVLEPEVLDFIPKNLTYDMTKLFDDLIKAKRKTSVFPVREYWMDVGHKDDLLKANGEFYEIFSE